MNESPRYALAEDLLLQEIDNLRKRLVQAQLELHGIRTGQVPKPSAHQPEPEVKNGALSCAEAIDAVLVRSKKPVSAREIEDGFKTYRLAVQGNPSITSIRSALHRRASALGWKKSGRGKRIKWARAQKGEA